MAVVSPRKGPPAPPRMRPNAEQLAIATAARGGRSFKIPAFAGTGKSTTLRLVAHVIRPKPMLYIVYNSANAVEARKKFRATEGYEHVTVSTAHALAFHEVGKAFQDRLEKRAFAIREAIGNRYRARLMRLSSEPHKALDAVMETLQRFQNGPDYEIGPQHVPDLAIMATPLRVVELAAEVFAEMTSIESDLPILHDTYFKYYQAVVRPRLDSQFDLIALDEGQDSNPVTLALLQDQQCAKIVVGDTHQSLYGFRQAVNAMESLQSESLPLTQSWRFGDAVARLANEILRYKKEKLLLRGAPNVSTRIVLNAPAGAVPNFVLARTNAGVFEEALHRVELRQPITIVGGVDELTGMVLGAYELWLNGKSTHPAFKYFRSWEELEAAAKGPQGAEYSPFVRIVDNHQNTIPDKCAAIADGVGGEGAIRISTLHKAKGLEDDHVALGKDFSPFAYFDPKIMGIVFNPEEANVFYVGITRARKLLELGDAFASVLASSMHMAAKLMRLAPSPDIETFLTPEGRP